MSRKTNSFNIKLSGSCGTGDVPLCGQHSTFLSWQQVRPAAATVMTPGLGWLGEVLEPSGSSKYSSIRTGLRTSPLGQRPDQPLGLSSLGCRETEDCEVAKRTSRWSSDPSLEPGSRKQEAGSGPVQAGKAPPSQAELLLFSGSDWSQSDFPNCRFHLSLQVNIVRGKDGFGFTIYSDTPVKVQAVDSGMKELPTGTLN